jgi:uncharacterized protein (UPF0332 family)
MNETDKALVSHRIARAFESLEEAKVLIEKNLFYASVNRLYYACFYIASALLLTKGLSSGKHSGVRAFFHQNFVKTGILSKEMGRIYDNLFDNRQKGDYSDFIKFDKNDVLKWFDETKIFVEETKKIIDTIS